MTKLQLYELYRSAAAIINLHGGTELLPEHCQCPVRIYVGTDPVDVEVHLHHGNQKYLDLLRPHTAFFTWGLNYGQPDCKVPVSSEFNFQPICPPVIVDMWNTIDSLDRCRFTTIGNYRQGRRNALQLGDKKYHWSKHLEFRKFMDVPRRTNQEFELALSRNSYTPEDQQELESHGWHICDALTFSTDVDGYRNYIQQSRGEFTVAKDQNIRLRSGWFSERSAQYLAAGRPVITQDTGFGCKLPTGEGVFAFSTMDEVLSAVETINADYGRHCSAAQEVARTCFDLDIVLPQLLDTTCVNRDNQPVRAALNS
jgi:hypothetical protein